MRFVLLIFFLMFCLPSFSQNNDANLDSIFRVGGIENIETMTVDEEKQIETRIRRTGVFQHFEIRKNEEFKTKFDYKKKWTSIPIFKFRNSGADNLFTIGLYDSDAFNSLHEFGGQFERLNKANSFVAWSRLNGIFSWKNKFGFEFWNQARDIFLRDERFALKEIYGLLSTKGVFFLERSLKENPLLRLKFQSEYIQNRYTQRGFSNEERSSSNSYPPPSGNWIRLSSNLTIGEIDYFQPGLESGHEAGTTLYTFNNFQGKSCAGIEASYKFITKIPYDWFFGSNFRSGYISPCERSFLYHFGGLFDVRGLPESAIVGNSFFMNNSELRKLLIDGNWSRVQFVLGHDLIFANSVSPSATSASSITTGLRFIFPRVYRLNIRTDVSREYQKGLTKFSFGLQQFF